MEIVSKNKITLKLVAGKKWRADAGFIIAKTVNIAGKTYPLAGLDGKWFFLQNIYFSCLCYCIIYFFCFLK
jgi:hypothetical protein